MLRTWIVAASFVEYQRLRSLSPRTVEFYQWGLNHLVKFHAELPVHHRELIPILAQPQLGRESRHDLARVLKKFFKWAATEYAVPNPTMGMERLPRRKVLPRVFSHAEVDAVLASCLSARDRGLVALVLDTGVRVAEIAGMTKSDLDSSLLRVNGKIGRRQVPISPELTILLMSLGDDNFFWTGPGGHPLTYWGVKNAFRRVFQRAGLKGPKLGPHTLRHTFATEYCRAGGNVRVLQSIMGHESLSTTMIYVHSAGLAVSQDHARCSPLRRVVETLQ